MHFIVCSPIYFTPNFVLFVEYDRLSMACTKWEKVLPRKEGAKETVPVDADLRESDVHVLCMIAQHDLRNWKKRNDCSFPEIRLKRLKFVHNRLSG